MNLKKSKSLVPMSINLKNRSIVYILFFFVVGGSLLSILNNNNNSYNVYTQYENIVINTTKLTDTLYMLQGSGGNIIVSVGQNEVFI
jgi:hypothetical protein